VRCRTIYYGNCVNLLYSFLGFDGSLVNELFAILVLSRVGFARIIVWKWGSLK
jgi:hypothetical protein